MPNNRDQLESIVGRLLRAGDLTLAVAESCTGGLIAHRITNVPGSSDYFRGSVTVYSYESKETLLGVPRPLLEAHGAVSAPVARQMAARVRQVVRADLGLSATGIAGPTGGTPEKPVGLVYAGLAADDGTRVESHVFSGDRIENKSHSADVALDLLRRYLEGRV